MSLRTDAVIRTSAEIGVIILLFEVGLESDLKEMMEVGWSSLMVAVLGVIAPFLLGWGVFFFQAEDGIRHGHVTGVQTCALPISSARSAARSPGSPRRPPGSCRGR